MANRLRVDQNIFARIKQTRGNGCLHSHNLSYAVTRKSIQIIHDLNTRQSVPPDVPASLVTPPENPNSIRIELIGSATFKTWAGDRIKTVSSQGRLSSTVPGFSHPDCYSGISQSCKSIHTPSSLLRTHPNGKRFQLLVRA